MIKTVLFSAILTISGAAVAAPTTTAQANSDSDCAAAKRQGRTCSLVFDEDDVRGERPDATGSTHRVLTRQARTSLIRLRTSFREQIIRTANEI